MFRSTAANPKGLTWAVYEFICKKYTHALIVHCFLFTSCLITIFCNRPQFGLMALYLGASNLQQMLKIFFTRLGNVLNVELFTSWGRSIVHEQDLPCIAGHTFKNSEKKKVTFNYS